MLEPSKPDDVSTMLEFGLQVPLTYQLSPHINCRKPNPQYITDLNIEAK